MAPIDHVAIAKACGFEATHADSLEELEAAHIMDCIECGACAYICPGRLHLTHTFKVGKQKVKDAAAKKKAAEAAAKAAAEAEKKEA